MCGFAGFASPDGLPGSGGDSNALLERMGEAIATYDGYVMESIVPLDFLQEYRNTLEEAADLMDGPKTSTRLRNLAEDAFSQAGLAY